MFSLSSLGLEFRVQVSGFWVEVLMFSARGFDLFLLHYPISPDVTAAGLGQTAADSRNFWGFKLRVGH